MLLFTSKNLGDIVAYYWFIYYLIGRVMKLQRSINIKKTVNIKLCQNREINHGIKLNDDTEIIRNNTNKY